MEWLQGACAQHDVGTSASKDLTAGSAKGYDAAAEDTEVEHE